MPQFDTHEYVKNLGEELMPPPPVLGVPSGRGVRPTPAACPAALNAWLYHAIRAMRQGPRRPPLVGVEAALAHTVRNPTEAAYARSDLFERRRRLMDDWAAYLDERLASLISATADVCVGEQTGRGSSRRVGLTSRCHLSPDLLPSEGASMQALLVRLVDVILVAARRTSRPAPTADCVPAAQGPIGSVNMAESPVTSHCVGTATVGGVRW